MTPQPNKPSDIRYLKMLVFGPSGHGKTRFAGTAQLDERTRPSAVLDFEGGSSTLAGLDIDVFKMRSWQDYNDFYNAFANGELRYNSLTVDSGSETYMFTLLDILEKEKARRSGRPYGGDLIEQGDYNIAQTKMRRLLREFRDLDTHVIVTSLDKDFLEPREGMVKKPNVAGAFANEFPGIFDVVGYLVLESGEGEQDKPRRILWLKNQPKFRVKIRTHWMNTEDELADVPDGLTDPTVTKLLDVLSVPMPQSATSKRS